MLKKYLAVGVLMLLTYGCSSSGVNVRGYVENRARVDQGKDGNSGFLAGTVKDNTQPVKPTRKIYVVEISKETKEAPRERTIANKSNSSETMTVAKEAAQATPDVSLPQIQDEKIVITKDNTGASFTEYKVEKDDTLQKLAKKFYGTYSKWPKIYEANKDVIKNPDFLKPGITIKIPQL